MLFILTGDIQIGKTRWLQELTATLEHADVPVAGVLAPGVWRENAACDNGLEKIGIDNEMLPGHELVHFARRRDLLLAEDGADSLRRCGQSETEQLGWAMDDSVIEQVDAHFAALEAQVIADGEHAEKPRPSLLVVDELGRLELLRELGLVHATSLLQRGPSARYPHAVLIVRDWLLPKAHERFDAAWPDAVEEIAPTADARTRVLGAYGVTGA
ncbi:MAG: hypothetical protein KHY83_05500 [Coriobacteriia bacterium]|nr:hypothetical protein [Coriobacteriia bacterium]MBS5478102.1 hypothetical protein [Coriobacteriia bacterium]